MTTRLKSIDPGYPREFAVDFMGCPDRASIIKKNNILKLETGDEGYDDEELEEEEEEYNV